MSMVMSQNSSLECEMLTSFNETLEDDTDEDESGRSKRDTMAEINEGGNRMPNIDFLLNPKKQGKRNEYEGYVMSRLMNFFEERNSSMLYPNLFR